MFLYFQIMIEGIDRRVRGRFYHHGDEPGILWGGKEWEKHWREGRYGRHWEAYEREKRIRSPKRNDKLSEGGRLESWRISKWLQWAGEDLFFPLFLFLIFNFFSLSLFFFSFYFCFFHHGWGRRPFFCGWWWIHGHQSPLVTVRALPGAPAFSHKLPWLLMTASET